jgi:hypothetical protein
MPRQFLVYWPWTLVLREFEEVKILAHDASNKFEHRHIVSGDVLWYVTCPADSAGDLTGQLVLFGHMIVGETFYDNESAQRYLTQAFGLRYTVRQDARIHVFTRPGTQEPYNLVDVTAIASALRFDSAAGHDRLSTTEGHVTAPQEMQALRLLQPVSIALLEGLWATRVRVKDPADPSTVLPLPSLEPDDQAFPEGSVVQRTHLARERNRALVARAKQRFKELHGGRVFCQVCGFDFAACYGPLGADYIEAHHTVPVSELQPDSVTRVEDLAIVCANCHRMLHRKRPWLTMDELRSLLV